MMRSLWSGVSGLKVHQTKMDVIGNNISNVNTVGFRSSSVNFTDVFYQTTQSASGPNADTGAAGKNAVQIGLGSNVAAVSVNMSGTGATSRTDRGMDLMINGDAFFIVKSGTETYFTKSGCFDVDASGTLYCTTNGASVLGWGVDERNNIRKDTVDTIKLMSPENKNIDPQSTSAVTLSGNIDSKDPLVQYDVNGAGYPIAMGFYDSLGNYYTAKLTTMKSNETTDTEYSLGVSDILDNNGVSILKQETLDEAGNKTYVSTEQYVNFAGNDLSYTVDPDGTVTFDKSDALLTFNGATGAFVSVTGESEGKLNLKLNDGAATNNPFPVGGIDIDFSALTMFASSGNSAVNSERGDVDGYNAGNSAGSINGFTINPDGKIYAVYDNGDDKLLGQIAVASFANPSGLEAVGNSLFAATLNSGEFDGIGKDISELGSFSIGALEMSDVDLATEFTNMITTQRGFQANSRTITTSDSMLEELINLKR
ncbi:flagellar hook protein FlgE [Eubacterium xylanophilum]|uniref:flagellar hook protein FlgE n=1 Tax=Eubacterium xylanophilum TaxID=39497 RepID=UPI00047B9F53|nr:flagellar hook-basal body complex protein [Eubacterium xylanophilum]